MAKHKRVRTGATYTYRPVGIDLWDPKSRAQAGQRVRVTQPYGCPKNGTMGHCYIESLAGEFLGLVLCNSLASKSDDAERVRDIFRKHGTDYPREA